jgi:hypothetical protein
LDHDSDHIPLDTVLAKPTRERTFPEKWNWELTDQERLHHVLAQNLPELTTLTTEQDIDNATKAIVSAILVAVNESNPKREPARARYQGGQENVKRRRSSLDA